MALNENLEEPIIHALGSIALAVEEAAAEVADKIAPELFVRRWDGWHPTERFRVAGKLRTKDGMKARQRDSKIDRSIPFRDALRHYHIQMIDVDIFLFDSQIESLRMVCEVTCADDRIWSRNYFTAIDERRDREGNNRRVILVGQEMNRPVMLVCFEPDILLYERAHLWRRILWTPEGVHIPNPDWHQWESKPFFEGLRNYLEGRDRNGNSPNR